MTDYYSSIASGYDDLHRDEQRAKLAVITSVVQFSAEESVLDVGCGTGVATKELPCKLTGVDPSAGLLALCPFPTVCCGGEKLPFEDNSFDHVISLTAFHHLSSFSDGLSEMLRVSRGWVIISVLKTGQKFQEIDSLLCSSPAFEKKREEEKDMVYFLREHFP